MNPLKGIVKCAKCLLIGSNLLFMLSGIGLIVAGTYVQLEIKGNFSLVEESLSSAAALVTTTGVITLLVACIGFCCVLTEIRKFIHIYMVMLATITVLQITAGISGFVLMGRLYRKLWDYLLAIIQTQDDVWDVIQPEFQCCGLNSPYDWENLAGLPTVPASCCPSPVSGCNFTTSFNQGCLSAIWSSLKSKVYIIGAVGVAFLFIQVVGFIFTCFLSRGLKKEYEKV